MGRRGPLPDPKSERSATGRNTLRRPSKAKPEAQAASTGGVAPPSYVTAVPAALDFWTRISPRLLAEGRLAAEHVDSFGQLARIYADVLQLQEIIAAEGWVIATDKGQAVSPIAKLLRDSRRDFVTLAGKFGLTAADAARLPTDEDSHGQEDPDEAALRAFTG